MAPEPFRATVLRHVSLVAVLTLLAPPVHALRLMDWNVLNYPGSTGPTRDPGFRTVLAPLSPDVLVTEEQTSQAGVTEFLNSLNTMEPGQWAAATFVDGNDTDTGLFYKPAKVSLLGEWAFYPDVPTDLRYVHVYRLKPVGYSSDGAEFRVYAVHLKADKGPPYNTERQTECVGLRDSMNAMPSGMHAIITGDFNFYGGVSTEPGLQSLIESDPNNIGRVYDPLGFDQTTTWQDNLSLATVWTQSPCGTGDTGCASGAATGGIDDRFDLILPTYPWQSGSGLSFVPNSYISVGNDGQHHNVGINAPPTIPEGAAYATALHSVSDHLPVRVDISVPAILSVSATPIAFGTVIVGATASQALAVTDGAATPGEALNYTYTAPAGFLAPIGMQTAAAGVTNNDAIALDTSAPGTPAGSLQIVSNALDSPIASIPLSGTVLRHAVPSLDSLASVTSGTLAFGAQDSASFLPLDVRAQNLGYDALQARLSVGSASITGGAGRFSIVGGFTPALLAGTGQTWSVAFDPGGATPDSEYDATLSLSTADEPLPGGTAQASLSLALSATLTGSSTTGVADAAPRVTRMYAPFPNPVQGPTTLRFDVAHAGHVALEIFDVTGRRAATLANTDLAPGRYALQWDGIADGAPVSRAGLYFVRFTAPGITRQSKRLVIVK
ncbi:MAG TPA: hypothetical protein VMH61_06900 [Candidatus Acidoferrales bacterium]|nr:hypothetical protein [Candidatus Acidoferrales bacterium]